MASTLMTESLMRSCGGKVRLSPARVRPPWHCDGACCLHSERPVKTAMSSSSDRYPMVDLSELPGVPCPCGVARRAFADLPDYPLTVHLTEIHLDARTHYHRRLTETYYILECEAGAAIELDGQRQPLHAGMCVVIRPGVRHRAVGRMKILNIVHPKFDAADEWYD